MADVTQLQTDVDFLTSQPGWQNADSRREYIRNVGAKALQDPEMDPLHHGAVMSELWKRADDRGALRKAGDWMGSAAKEIAYSVPAAGAALGAAVSDAVGYTDSGSGERVMAGLRGIVDTGAQRFKAFHPNDKQEELDGVLTTLKQDLDARAYPDGLEAWVAGHFDSDPAIGWEAKGKPDAETQAWIDGLTKGIARKAVAADHIDANEPGEVQNRRVEEWLKSDRNPAEALSWEDEMGPGPRSLLGDYLVTRDPASWNAFVARVKETDTQFNNRRARFKAESGARRALAQKPEGVNKTIAERGMDFQTSPMDMAATVFPFLKGAKAFAAARAGAKGAAVTEAVKGTLGEAFSEGLTEALSDPNAPTSRILNAAGMGGFGGAVVTGVPTVAGALMKRPVVPATVPSAAASSGVSGGVSSSPGAGASGAVLSPPQSMLGSTVAPSGAAGVPTTLGAIAMDAGQTASPGGAAAVSSAAGSVTPVPQTVSSAAPSGTVPPLPGQGQGATGAVAGGAVAPVETNTAPAGGYRNIRSAVRLPAGNVVIGEYGQTHADMLFGLPREVADSLAMEDIGFGDASTGNFLSEKEAVKQLAANDINFADLQKVGAKLEERMGGELESRRGGLASEELVEYQKSRDAVPRTTGPMSWKEFSNSDMAARRALQEAEAARGWDNFSEAESYFNQAVDLWLRDHGATIGASEAARQLGVPDKGRDVFNKRFKALAGNTGKGGFNLSMMKRPDAQPGDLSGQRLGEAGFVQLPGASSPQVEAAPQGEPAPRARMMQRVLENRGVEPEVAARAAGVLDGQIPASTAMEDVRDAVLRGFEEMGGRFPGRNASGAVLNTDPAYWESLGHPPERAREAAKNSADWIAEDARQAAEQNRRLVRRMKEPGRLEAWADGVIRESRNRLHTGIDPVLMSAYAVKGAVLIRNGIQDFTAWSAEMVKQYGEAVREYLRGAWEQARALDSRDTGGGVATDSGAAQPTEPSPGGVSEADAETRYVASKGKYESAPPIPFYTASTEAYARNFGGNVIEVTVAPQNTLDLTDIAADADDGGKLLREALASNGIDVSGLSIFSDDELAQALNRNLKPLSERIAAAGYDSVRLNEYVHNGGSDVSVLIVSDSALYKKGPTAETSSAGDSEGRNSNFNGAATRQGGAPQAGAQSGFRIPDSMKQAVNAADLSSARPGEGGFVQLPPEVGRFVTTGTTAAPGERSTVAYQGTGPYRVQNGIKRAILKGTTLPTEFAQEIANTRDEVEAVKNAAARVARDLDGEMRRQAGLGIQTRDQLEQIVNDALDDPAQMAVLGATNVPLHSAAVRARNMLDQLSQAIAMQAGGNVGQTIMSNLGSWMRRSYMAFDASTRWNLDNLRAAARAGRELNGRPARDILRDAEAYLRSQTPGMSAAQLEYQMRQLTDRTVWMGTLTNDPNTRTTKDVSSLIRRRDIHPAVRALMGEVRDPLARFAQSADWQSQFIARHQMQERMRDLGLNMGIFSDQPVGVYTEKVGGEDGPTRAWSGFGDDLYTTPEMMEALRNAQGVMTGTDVGGWFLNTIKFLGGEAKLNKVVTNPDSWMVNLYGSLNGLVASGDLLSLQGLRNVWRAWYQTRQAGRRVDFTGNPTDRAAIEAARQLQARLEAAGVLNGGFDLQDLMANLNNTVREKMESTRVKDVATGAVRGAMVGGSYAGGVGATVGAVVGAAAGGKRIVEMQKKFGEWLISKPDNFAKTIAYLNNFESYSRAGLAPAQAHERAAAIVRDTLPDYSKLPGLARELSRLGVTGSFIAFQYEVYRNVFHNFRYAAFELRSGNPVLMKRGAERLLGVSTVLTLGGWAAVSALMFGKGEDDERDEAYRRALARPWDANSPLVYSKLDDKGVTFWNMGYLIPQSTIFDLLRGAMSGRSFGESMENVYDVARKQFVDGGVHTNPLLEAVMNDRRGGGKVSYSEDMITNAWERFEHARSAIFTPGYVDKAKRMTRAVLGRQRGDRVYTIEEEVKRLLGIRQSTYTHDESIAGRLFEFRERADSTRQIAKMAYNEWGKSKPDARGFVEQQRAVEQANATRAQIAADYKAWLGDLAKLGITESRVNRIRKDRSASFSTDPLRIGKGGVEAGR